MTDKENCDTAWKFYDKAMQAHEACDKAYEQALEAYKKDAWKFYLQKFEVFDQAGRTYIKAQEELTKAGKAYRNRPRTQKELKAARDVVETKS